jgi:AcrR family transcriptional regulator
VAGVPAQKTTREEALTRIAEVFRAHGYDGTSLSRLSEATGLGRASLYHHFPGGKEEMAREVFNHLGAAVDAHLLAPLRGTGSVEGRLRKHIRGVRAFYAAGSKNCLLGAITLSGGSDLFKVELAASFRGWIDALAKLLRETGLTRGVARRRAEVAVAQIQGGLILARGLGDDAQFLRVLEALPAQLLEED